jgi:hypothetical protein
LTVFSALAEIPLDTRPISFSGTIAAGFFGPFLYFNRQEQQHAAESTRVYLELVREEHAKRVEAAFAARQAELDRQS